MILSACVLMTALLLTGTLDDGRLDQRPSVASPSRATATRAIAERTNAERRRAGLSTLKGNSRLERAAQIHADQLARAARLAHDLPGARYPTLQDRLKAAGYAWRAIGENLASGQTDAAAVIAAWMRSQGHRANILNPTFTELGIGRAVDGSGRQYYVQVFGAPR